MVTESQLADFIDGMSSEQETLDILTALIWFPDIAVDMNISALADNEVEFLEVE